MNEYQIINEDDTEKKNNNFLILNSIIILSLFCLIALIVLIPIIIIIVSLSSQHESSLIIINAKIWKDNKVQNRSRGIAVLGNKIVEIDNSEYIYNKYFKNSTKVIDCKNKYLVLPGFVDNHVHLLGGNFII
jgi:hypothetical protein